MQCNVCNFEIARDSIITHVLTLEDACNKQTFSSIPPQQIQLLKESLLKLKTTSKLGVQNLPRKDKSKMIKDSKKRGCKLDLLLILMLGTKLVESRKYAQLTKLF